MDILKSKREIDGYAHSDEIIHGLEVSFDDITTRAIAQHLKSLMGKYATIRTGRFKDLDDRRPAAECLAECIRRLWTPQPDKPLLIVGMGNEDRIGDSLGPEVVRNIPVRQISDMGTPCVFGSVFLLAPGIVKQASVSTVQMISGMAQVLDAACVILIGGVGITNFEAMCSIINVSTSGFRFEGGGELLSSETLGVPVLDISVPLLWAIPAWTVKMLHLRENDEGIMLMDLEVEADSRAAVSILTQGILRAVYPELDLDVLNETAKRS